ncbi:hypothetical protein HMPREF1076_04477 [Parabacteroides goldsteinii CL02T12C30]|uniref:STAS domain-containing protein n=1 Tax=Parabacteroides goldsteinii CL02T12C30 TaxID=999418 RepID=K6A182_9BACT|nr:hypothetical protein HMPREF1076_04477 [Parabacteroides goldsteinii CL02T12C30]
MLPPLFYMRRDYLHKVIPTLRKLIKYPSNEVYIDFSEVEEITRGSYMVLLAQAEKAMKMGKVIYVFKRLPKSQDVLKILGYKDKIFHKDIDLTKGNALTNNTVDTQMVDELVSELKRIGINEYYQVFYDFLVELIGNATEHGIQHNKISWWLLKYRIPEQKAFKYVFVDMGVGIIRSYKESKSLGINRFRSSKWIVNNAFDGKLGSSTGQDNRGRGLPFIRSCVEKGFISDFILITNNVSLQCLDGKIVENSNPDFVGTYLSWTINKENFIRWKNSK